MVTEFIQREILRLKGPHSAEQFIEDDTERVDVRARIDTAQNLVAAGASMRPPLIRGGNLTAGTINVTITPLGSVARIKTVLKMGD